MRRCLNIFSGIAYPGSILQELFFCSSSTSISTPDATFFLFFFFFFYLYLYFIVFFSLSSSVFIVLFLHCLMTQC